MLSSCVDPDDGGLLFTTTRRLVFVAWTRRAAATASVCLVACRAPKSLPSWPTKPTRTAIMSKAVHYIGECEDCWPTLDRPFANARERDRWALAHNRATGHKVILTERPDAVEYSRARSGECNEGLPLWRHACGHVEAFDETELAEILGGCDACESGSDNPDDWQALWLANLADKGDHG